MARLTFEVILFFAVFSPLAFSAANEISPFEELTLENDDIGHDYNEFPLYGRVTEELKDGKG